MSRSDRFALLLRCTLIPLLLIGHAMENERERPKSLVWVVLKWVRVSVRLGTLEIALPLDEVGCVLAL